MTNRNTFYKKHRKLLLDDNFIRWRLLPDEELDRYWEDMLKRYPDLIDEIRLADEYLRTTTFKKQKLDSSNKNILLERILKSIIQKEKKPLSGRFIYGAVASIIIIIGLTFFFFYKNDFTYEEISGNILNSEDIQLISNNKSNSFNNNVTIKIGDNGVAKVNEEDKDEEIAIDTYKATNTLIVPYGKRSSIELSDGTKITLNAGSSIEFTTNFGSTRNINLLSGEIYVEVAHHENWPFYVHTPSFKVNVHGTTFNITAYDKQPHSIVLVEGSLELQYKDMDTVNLTPNQRAVVTDSGNFEVKEVDVNNYISWKEGYIILDEISVADLLKIVEKYYNLSFDYEKNNSLQQITCKGKLYLPEDVDKVMNAIALLSSTKYKREDKTIYITNKPNIKESL